MKKFIIDKNTSIKLIKFLQKTARNMPDSEIHKSLRKKKVKVNGKRITDSKFQLNVGDIVELYVNDEFFEPIKTSNIWEKVEDDLVILYEDKNILIVDKPAGLLCHEDEHENVQTLLNKARKHVVGADNIHPQTALPAHDIVGTTCARPQTAQTLHEHVGADNIRPQMTLDRRIISAPTNSTPSTAICLCHRLDRNTRGLVIIAKNAIALREMTLIIRNRLINKFYICEVEGEVKNTDWITAKAHLTRDLSKKQVYITDYPTKDSKEILTKYRKIPKTNLFPHADNCQFSTVNCQLLTGRTHQIRAHLAHLGYPLIGDAKYGNAKGKSRQHLIASRLEFLEIPAEFELAYLSGKSFQIDS